MECLIRDGLPAVPATWWTPAAVVAAVVAVAYYVLRVPLNWTKVSGEGPRPATPCYYVATDDTF